MLTNSLDRKSISGGTRAAISVLLFFITAVVAAAQSGFVTFTGTISDEGARGVPNVTVTLSNEARQAKYEVKTNATGRYEFVGLPAGEDALEVKGMGFSVGRDTVAIAGQNLQRDYKLTLGTLQETVTVVDDGRDPKPSAIRERAAAPRAECVASAAGGQIRPPKKLRDFAPTYPASLRSTGTNGVVVLKARIGLDGYLTDIAVEGEAHPEFASAALVAVREWMFSETLLNCEPVVVGMTITVNFNGTPRP